MKRTSPVSIVQIVFLLTGGLFCLHPGAASGSDVRVGLVSYWPLDVDNSGTTPDYGSLGNPMTVFGGSIIVPGQYNNAFLFMSTNGQSQYLNVTHTTDNTVTGLPIWSSANGYTVCCWVKGPPVGTGNLNARYLFTEGSTASSNPLLVLQTRNSGSGGHLDAFLRTTGGTILVNHRLSGLIVFDNNWHHIAWTDDHGTARLYVDGVSDPANSTNAFNYNYTVGALAMNTTTIGALVRSPASANSGFATNTAIDEVALWQRVLSQDEINKVRTNSLTIPTVPEIVQQPAGSTNQMGDRVTFTVWGVGAPPLTYQWLKNDVAISGKTAYTLTLTDLIASSSNVFSVVVANGSGSVTSSYAPLVVLADAAPDPSAGLVSFWPMDVVNYTASNTNTPDVYYSHTDLVLSNMDQSYLVTGQFSNALAFNQGASSTQYGKRAGGSPVYGLTNYTVSLWVNGFASQNNKQLFAEGGASDFWLLGTENPASGGLLNVKFSPGMSDRKSTRTVFDNTWHHVVWVDEAGKGKLYVDGVLDETDFTYNRSNLTLSATAICALYRSSPANYFLGNVDEVCIWKRRLSYTEIQQIKTSGVPPPSIVGPVITQQPVGSTNHQGDRITLTVTATGTDPSYQWRKDAAPVAGATSTSLPLLLTAAATNDYTVVITNIAGSVTSAAAHVVVLADAAPDVRAGLFYYWPLDTVNDGPPATSPDLYCNDPMGLVNLDSSWLVTGQFGNALHFGGAAQASYGARTGGAPIYLTTNYTVSLWVRGGPDTALINRQVFAEGGAGGQYFFLGTENSNPAGDKLNLKINPGMGDRKSTRSVFNGNWHHVVWVDENGKGKLYIDGTLDETDFSYTRGPSVALESTTLGALYRTGPANYFFGDVDDVGVWNRRLSQTEINLIESSGIPASLAPIAPVIFTQPSDKTNDVWATDSVSFSVQASGTSPLSFQWLKNGVPLDPAINSSATNPALTFAYVQTSDAGSYAVVITNTVGSITSRVARLTVNPYVPVTSGDALKLDFEAAATSNLQPGFTRMAIPLSGMDTNFGGIKVTLSTVTDGGGTVTLADRDRVALGGAVVVDNPPALTQSALYNDFIFVNQSSYPNGNGIRVRIERLAHSTPFGVSIWAYDIASSGLRYSDWIETGSGSTIIITNGYTFDGTAVPTRDYDATLGALLTSTASGVLQIEARKNGGSTTVPAVFVNAIRLVANPVIRITSAQMVGGNLRLTIEAQYPNQPLSLQQRSDLGAGGSWGPATGIVAAEMHGTVATVDLTLGGGPIFYRVSSP